MLKIIVSPAKKMRICEEYPCGLTEPVFLSKTKHLLEFLKKQSITELQALWQCSDKKLAQANFQRLHTYHLFSADAPALLAYEGIQYQYLSPFFFSLRSGNM